MLVCLVLRAEYERAPLCICEPRTYAVIVRNCVHRHIDGILSGLQPLVYARLADVFADEHLRAIVLARRRGRLIR